MFKQSFKLFLESKELGVLRPRPLSSVELSKAKAAAAASVLIHDMLQKTEHDIEPDDVIKLHDRLQKYSKVKFVSHLVKDLGEMIEAFHRSGHAGDSILMKHGELKDNIKNMKAAFMKKDMKASKEHKDKIDAHLHGIDHHVNLPKRAHYTLKNRYTSKPSFLGTTRLLDTIDDSDYNKIRALDFSEELYTVVDFPSSKEDDFDYVLYFLTHLLDSPKPVRVDKEHDFRLHTKVKFAKDEKYDKLVKIIDRYLHGNDHSLIPEILKLINSIPQIREANEKAKRSIKVVYRGLGFGEDEDHSEEEIIDEEHKRKYVATSESKYAAKNFALQKGHLEHEDSRRSSHGVIIVYHVKPDAILFDTRVVDTVFNESEILIDAAKAKVAEILEV